MRIIGVAIDDPAATAWRDTFQAVRQMTGLFIAAGIVLLVLDATELLTHPSRPSFGPPDSYYFLKLSLWGFAFGVTKAFLLAPVAIAVHRHVLLDEVTAQYALKPSDRRFMLFFFFGILFQIILLVPFAPMSLMGLGSSMADIYFNLALLLILLVIAWIVCLRLLILFPAIAVDATGIHWRNAMRDSRGHFWQILMTVFVTALPFWLLLELRAWFVPASLAHPAGLVLKVPIELLLLAALAAAASGLYRTFAHELGRPSALATVAP